jgi:hypothetical protein
VCGGLGATSAELADGPTGVCTAAGAVGVRGIAGATTVAASCPGPTAARAVAKASCACRTASVALSIAAWRAAESIADLCAEACWRWSPTGVVGTVKRGGCGTPVAALGTFASGVAAAEDVAGSGPTTTAVPAWVHEPGDWGAASDIVVAVEMPIVPGSIAVVVAGGIPPHSASEATRSPPPGRLLASDSAAVVYATEAAGLRGQSNSRGLAPDSAASLPTMP